MFVILEGIENSGKTAIIDRLCLKYKIIKKIELSKFADDIKRIIEQCKNEDNELTNNQIDLIKSIKEIEYIDQFKNNRNEEILIATCYLPFDIAYARTLGMNSDVIEKIESVFPKPDCKIFLDVSPEESIRRSGNTNTLDNEKRLSFLEKFSSSFKDVVEKDGDWFIIDTNTLDEEQVYNKVEKIVEGWKLISI